VSAVLVMMLCGCPDRSESSFEQERQSVQKTWSATAELVRTGDVRRNNYTMEASWEYDFAGERSAAVEAFAKTKPANYELLHRTDTRLTFSRYDGHDSYQIVVTFGAPDAATQKSTKVAVVLKGFPD
jgi:hypothetical protein